MCLVNHGVRRRGDGITALIRMCHAMVLLTMHLVAWPGLAQVDANHPMDAKQQSLSATAQGRFQIGTAITSQQLNDPNLCQMVLRQFNHITPEYEMFPQFLHPEPDVWTFERADKVVDFAHANGLPVVGHMLLWHHFAPAWLFEDDAGKPLSREEGLQRLEDHVAGVLKHYEGKIDAWYVLNEAVSDQPGEDLRDTPALRCIGEDYPVRLFAMVHRLAPDATLIYNDYNIEDPAKLQKTLRLVRSIQAAGVPVHGVGIQGHWLLAWPPTEQIGDAIEALKAEGCDVLITELDVDVLPRPAAHADLGNRLENGADPYVAGLDANTQRQLADRYQALFETFAQHDADVSRITFWGVHDGQSWLNDFPVKGRTNHPLLLDRDLNPKPAFDAVMKALGNPLSGQPGHLRRDRQIPD